MKDQKTIEVLTVEAERFSKSLDQHASEYHLGLKCACDLLNMSIALYRWDEEKGLPYIVKAATYILEHKVRS